MPGTKSLTFMWERCLHIEEDKAIAVELSKEGLPFGSDIYLISEEELKDSILEKISPVLSDIPFPDQFVSKNQLIDDTLHATSTDQTIVDNIIYVMFSRPIDEDFAKKHNKKQATLKDFTLIGCSCNPHMDENNNGLESSYSIEGMHATTRDALKAAGFEFDDEKGTAFAPISPTNPFAS